MLQKRPDTPCTFTVHFTYYADFRCKDELQRFPDANILTPYQKMLSNDPKNVPIRPFAPKLPIVALASLP
jgi:hypothetical protein